MVRRRHRCPTYPLRRFGLVAYSQRAISLLVAAQINDAITFEPRNLLEESLRQGGGCHYTANRREESFSQTGLPINGFLGNPALSYVVLRVLCSCYATQDYLHTAPCSEV